ncbi:hypothetical protein BSKO_08487 [Bryopsis sp. KO-2023]|nr:hypothetical protein BSKO_08487 [Bryopsis sp. KO-2023]
MLVGTRTRLSGFLAGLGAGAAAFIIVQRNIWSSTATLVDTIPGSTPPAKPLEPVKPLLGANARNTVIQQWNKGIDCVFGGLAKELARRGL